MLTNWHIQNFKSFKESLPVSLSMVNVLAGANSSGKSTLIQSILLLKQTLQYGTEERPITLNGPLLRMGSFTDVCNNDASYHDDLRIGFSMDTLDAEESPNGKPAWAKSVNYRFQASESKRWDGISLALTFSPSDEQLDLPQEANPAPVLRQTMLTVRGRSDEGYVEQVINFTAPSRGMWPYQVTTDAASEEEMVDGKPEAFIEGGLISHFLPEIAVVRYNHTEVDVSALVDAIFRYRSTLLSVGFSSNEVLSPSVAAIFNDWFVSHGISPIAEDLASPSELNSKLANFIRPKVPWSDLLAGQNQSDEIKVELDRLKIKVKAAILAERKTEMRASGARSDGLDYAVKYISDYFKFGVRYLGPLRDSPRPVYQPEALEGTTDVGYRGEHTAAIYEINKHQRITYRLPPSDDTELDYVNLASTTSAQLGQATSQWLQYLGVAASVQTTDAGVYGNRMRVSMAEGAPLHDLTNVGVGVSQVLPIVVMALLAPRGSLLIFEQPELHLHPKVQARLADFFLALALDGKQTLLETHSEYLVDRLRLRIAMAPDDSVRHFVNILFSEKKGTSSSLTPVEISEYGAILNWPTDFFEQSQRDVSRIVQAAARKRKNKSR